MTTEQKLAGTLRLPPKSEPWAPQTWPLATAAADPPDDPPGFFDVFQGLPVVPKTSLKVAPPAPNSGVFDLAMMTAPLDSSLSTV